jgi:dienelactone hydrolase
MKKFALVILLFVASTSLFAQYSAIGHRSESFIDASRSRTVTCEIYYPADASGNNVAVVSDTAHFPLLVFGHGFVMAYTSYATLRDSLVSRGYIMAFPTTETGFSPSHLDFGKDIAFVAEQIQLSNSNATDLFYDRIASTTCVMGHSMGGGASFLSVPFYSGITAIANLAAAETNPSAVAAATSLTIPALLIAGGNDCITPIATNQLLMYNAISNSCKNLISINGASHCQMGDANFNCSLGEATCTPAPAITREVQQAKVFQYLSLWLDAVLKNNCQSGIDFETLRDNDTSVTYSQFCSLCSSTSVKESLMNRIVLAPNPFDEITRFDLGEIVPEMEVCIFDITGRLMKRQFFYDQKSIQLDFSLLSNGTYVVQLLNVVKGEKKQLLAIKK